MLVIRREQMEVLRAHVKERSLRRMAAEIRKKTSLAPGVTEEGFLELLRKGMQTAEAKGLRDSFSMQAYLSLITRVGKDLLEIEKIAKKAQPILDDTSRSTSEKLAELEWCVSEHAEKGGA